MIIALDEKLEDDLQLTLWGTDFMAIAWICDILLWI